MTNKVIHALKKSMRMHIRLEVTAGGRMLS